MREPSYIASILDDLAACGSFDSLKGLSERYKNKVVSLPLTDTYLNRSYIYRDISDAAYYRSQAVLCRLSGKVAQALEYEAKSERRLRQIALYGTRGPNERT